MTDSYREISPLITALLGVMCGALFVAGAVVLKGVADPMPSLLVESWNIVALDDVDLDVDPTVQLSGLFECSTGAIDANPTVQFAASVSALDRSWEIDLPKLPARQIGSSCNDTGTPVAFGRPFSEQALDQLERLVTEPTRVRMHFSVSAGDGWVPASAVTNGFTITP